MKSSHASSIHMDQEQKNKKRQFRSISVKLLTFILVFSSLVTIILTGIQLYVDYRNDLKLIDDQIHQIEISHINNIALSFWSFDLEAIKIQLSGILALRDIQYLAVSDERDIILVSAGTQIDTNFIFKKIPIYILDNESQSKGPIIGSLLVTASLNGVYKRLWAKALLILSTQAVKTFVVSIFIIFIVQYMVSRRLKVLSTYARQLDLNRLNTPLVLPRYRKQRQKQDELDLVALAINEMRQKLKSSSIEIQTKARMEGEFEAAADIQQWILPKGPPIVPGYEISSLFIPALEISGDYFDFIFVNERQVGFVVADASGKGVPAAIHSSIARALLRDKSDLHDNPIKLFNALNRGLKNGFPSNRFLTMCYLLLDLESSKVTHISAGHEPIIHFKAKTGTCHLVRPKGFPFSVVHADIFEDELESTTISFQPGDLLLLYSDGLLDATNAEGKRFEEERLVQLTGNLHQFSADGFANEVRQTLMSFQGKTRQKDDITMIVIKREQHLV